jgi:hypothetical protein
MGSRATEKGSTRWSEEAMLYSLTILLRPIAFGSCVRSRLSQLYLSAGDVFHCFDMEFSMVTTTVNPTFVIFLAFYVSNKTRFYTAMQERLRSVTNLAMLI